MKTKLVRPALVGSERHCLSMLLNKQLILISLEDEKIEVGDKYLDDCGLIREAFTNDEDYWNRRPDYYKVIATQEQISPEYIQQFIEEYNKGVVNDIEIEMEEYWIHFLGIGQEKKYKLKLTNGFVTIIK